MKYVNANDVLPGELLSKIQNYYQGGYLYIPKESYCEVRQRTDYKIELEKRNQEIYLKHLEGRTNNQLGNIFHLSESSIRRIIAKEKERYQKMKTVLEQILAEWDIGDRQLMQIYPSAWEVGHSYVIKVYDNKEQLERNIKISEILGECGIPVAKIIPTKEGGKFVEYNNLYFFMSEKLRGSNISDMKDNVMAREMGCAMARLHRAFIKCEQEVDFWDNSLLGEMKGWIRENLEHNGWKLLGNEEFLIAFQQLERVYDNLPKQLIHRDVHFGNFLFFDGKLSGYIDFDLSQRNIRIFDVCYFLAGLLAEETDDAFTKKEWLEITKSVIAGYESMSQLSSEEKKAIPCVMACVEILFAAYFIGMKDVKHAVDAVNVFHFIQDCEQDLYDFLSNH